MKPTILLTGSAGFIGSNFVKYVMPLYEDKYRFVSIDKLVDKYNLHYVPTNHKFYLGDITDESFIDRLFEIEKPTYVIHAAAESFVQKSIENSAKFSHSNIYGTSVLIETSVKHKVKKFHYVGTDEQFGSLNSKKDTAWTESSICAPRNNYSVSKHAGEMLLHAANQVHGLSWSSSRGCNTYGPGQPWRNLVPKICIGLLKNQTIFLQDEGKPIREWIYATDHAQSWIDVLERGKDNEIYNVGTGIELSNLEMTNMISEIYKITPKLDLTTKREGQDFRYSINSNKLKSIGWSAKKSFENGLLETCNWYKENLHLFGE